MKKGFWISTFIILAGIIILALPDNGKKLITFNKDHGPSTQDAAGVLLIIGSWLYWISNIVFHWKKVYDKFKATGLTILLVILAAGTFYIISGIKNENDRLLYSGIFFSFIAYLLPAITAFKKNT